MSNDQNNPRVKKTPEEAAEEIMEQINSSFEYKDRVRFLQECMIRICDDQNEEE